MNQHSSEIKDIIEYLVKVYNNENVGGLNQNFFCTLPELDELIDSYFRDFENSDERNKAIAHKLETLNKLSFDKNEEGYRLYKDTTRESNLNLSKEEHLKYASSIYYHLKNSFIVSMVISLVRIFMVIHVLISFVTHVQVLKP